MESHELISLSLTPVSTIVSAYERFLDDDILYGRVLECSADQHFFLEPPSLANGHVSRRAVTVWDPLFKMWVDVLLLTDAHTDLVPRYHKESSGLSDAIP